MTSAGTLSFIEAQRVSTVLEDSVDALLLLTRITPQIIAHREELAARVGDEITRLVEEQKVLKEQFVRLLAERDGLRQLPNKTAYRDNQLEMREVERKLREASKVLCHNLKESPNVNENLLKLQSERAQLQALVGRTLRELREGHFMSMLQVVVEEKMKQERLESTVGKEREAVHAVKELQMQVRGERDAWAKESRSLQMEISKAKEELAREKARVELTTGLTQRLSNAQKDSRQRQYVQRELLMSEDLKKLTVASELETTVHNESEAFFARKEAQFRRETKEWSEKFEKDIQEVDHQLEELRLNKQRDQIALEELEDRFKQTEDFVKMEEAQRAMHEEELRQRLIRTRAAVRLQAWFRGVTTRRRLARRKKRRKRAKGK